MASLVYRFEGQPETKIIRTLAVDFEFVETLGLEVVEGRTFSRAFATDSSAFLINETAARALGFADPL